MNWLAPCKESVVRTILLDDEMADKRAAQRWAREKETNVRAGVCVGTGFGPMACVAFGLTLRA